ncbi:MAG: class I SAM-dependent RNA methyltransferase, partial [Pseudomonadota bacterium]
MPELTIERLGREGDGIAPGPVYAPRTLPGEVVAGDIVEGRMAAPKILRPVAERVAPACPHYGACGGCALMHAAPEFQTGWKAAEIARALDAVGLSAAVRPPHVSPEAARRRATLSARRTRAGAIAGFHGQRGAEIVAVPDCRVIAPALRPALAAAEALAALGGTRKGELKVAATATEGGLDLSITGGRPAEGELLAELVAVAEAEDLACLTWDGEVIAMRRPPAVRLGPARVLPPPGAFLQATAEAEAAMQADVAEATDGARRVVDLFAGCGTFTLPLAAGAEVHAVEAEGAMLAALDRGWREAPGLRRITTEVRDLHRRPLLPRELEGVEAVVTDRLEVVRRLDEVHELVGRLDAQRTLPDPPEVHHDLAVE